MPIATNIGENHTGHHPIFDIIKVIAIGTTKQDLYNNMCNVGLLLQTL